MQAFSIAFGRVSRATFSADPELRTQITDLVSRAYYNLHSSPITVAERNWANAIIAAALQLCMDSRIHNLTPRELVHVFENMIRISEEHLREAKRHASMASNVFYLKESALDAACSDHTGDFTIANSTVMGRRTAYSGRIANDIANADA